MNKKGAPGVFPGHFFVMVYIYLVQVPKTIGCHFMNIEIGR